MAMAPSPVTLHNGSSWHSRGCYHGKSEKLAEDAVECKEQSYCPCRHDEPKSHSKRDCDQDLA